MQHCRIRFYSCRSSVGLLLAVCAWGLLISPALAGRTVYVATNGLSQNAYSNWTDAATNIQMAVNVATNSDTVMISNGTYTLASVVSISSNITVVSINTNPADVFVNGNGAVHCFYLNAGAVTLAGITITNGYTSTANGGGVDVEGGNTILSNCVISGNVVTGSDIYYGGGVYGALGTTVTIKQCLLAGNRQYRPSISGTGGGAKFYGYAVIQDSTVRVNYANGDAGGINISGGGLISNCLIIGNTANAAGARGGGVYVDVGTLQVSGSSILSNYAGTDGGGIWFQGATVISNCVISGNTGGSTGGGINFGHSGSRVLNCEISRNSSGRGGGVRFQAIGATNLVNCVIKENTVLGSDGGAGIHAEFAGGSASYEIARNCLIVRNSSASNAGGVWKKTTLGSLVSCTIANNYAGFVGGMYNNSSSAHKNCIIYGNTGSAASDNDIYNVATAYTNDFYNCDIGVLQNPAQGNIAVNPQFVNTSTTNFRLQASSLCINAGTNLPWMNGAVDLDGRNRIDRFSGRVDMGAYEFLRSGSAVVVH